MTSRRRWLIAALGLAVFVAAGTFSIGAPRITLHNLGLTIDYPWSLAIGRFLAAMGAAIVSWAARGRLLRVGGGLLIGVVVLTSADLIASRIDVEPDGLAVRDLLGRERVRWSEVRQVDPGPDSITLWSTEGGRIRLATGSYRPDQRAALERVIAHRVATAAGTSPVR